MSLRATIELSLRATIELSLRATIELSLRATIELSLRATIELSLRATIELGLRATIELSLRATIEMSLRATIELSLRATIELSLRATIELSLRATIELSLRLLRTTIEVSLRATIELSLRATIELSLRATIELSLRTTIEVSLRTTIELSLRATIELSLRATIEIISLLKNGVKYDFIKKKRHTSVINKASTEPSSNLFVWNQSLLSGPVCFSPEFSGPVANVTVPRGRDAKFTCLVRHLGGYRVGWVKADTKAIQAIHTHVITHNPRVQVHFDDHSTWHLVIEKVTEDDKGPYMCQINTDPMISQMGFLEVLRPPEIDDEMSSGDVVVTEGEMATLICVAKGHPKPSVTWIREDNANITISDGHSAKQVHSWEGEKLTLRRVSRDDMGAYLCIAQNKVPPQVSKRVLLHVHFHPIIHVPNQLIGSPYGTDVTLECKVEASPKPVTFWSNSHGEMLMSSSKYKVSEEHNKPGGYSVHMRLAIRDLTAADIGNYACVAKNSIGEVDSNINVYYIPPPTTTPPRLLPNFIETNRVDQDDNRLTSPGFVPAGQTPIDAGDNEVFKTYEGSGLEPWLQRKKYEKGRSIPTSESASLPEIKPLFHDNNDMDNSLGTSSSNTQYSSGFASGVSDSLLSQITKNFALVALGLIGGLVIWP
ncbi:uncharacterized protein [Palaemon carinicauda]|uniref:uncharacterized protein n=1 Tax=Palaemon carinicauda TaxID=392227 RepID=UPI0035B66D50